MSHSFKFFMLVSCFFASFLVYAEFNKLEAACGRWGTYDNARGAWGGNGGWWGDSRSDWYGIYGTPEEHEHGGNYAKARHYRRQYCSDRYYNNYCPQYGQYYSDTVDGAGFYFNIR